MAKDQKVEETTTTETKVEGVDEVAAAQGANPPDMTVTTEESKSVETSDGKSD